MLIENKENLKAQIANDNSEGQIVLSGKTEDLEKLTEILKDSSIKNIKLPVSAPFHCELMSNATKIMSEELNKLNFKNGENDGIKEVFHKNGKLDYSLEFKKGLKSGPFISFYENGNWGVIAVK